MPQCDLCKKNRKSVRSVGRDLNGDLDAPDVCFICEREHSRGRIFSASVGKYVDSGAPTYEETMSYADQTPHYEDHHGDDDGYYYEDVYGSMDGEDSF